MTDFQKKYLKYKKKYLDLVKYAEQVGGITPEELARARQGLGQPNQSQSQFASDIQNARERINRARLQAEQARAAQAEAEAEAAEAQAEADRLQAEADAEAERVQAEADAAQAEADAAQAQAEADAAQAQAEADAAQAQADADAAQAQAEADAAQADADEAQAAADGDAEAAPAPPPQNLTEADAENLWNMMTNNNDGATIRFRNIIRFIVRNRSNPLVEKLLARAGLSDCRVLNDFTTGNPDCGDKFSYIVSAATPAGPPYWGSSQVARPKNIFILWISQVVNNTPLN